MYNCYVPKYRPSIAASWLSLGAVIQHTIFTSLWIVNIQTRRHLKRVPSITIVSDGQIDYICINPNLPLKYGTCICLEYGVSPGPKN